MEFPEVNNLDLAFPVLTSEEIATWKSKANSSNFDEKYKDKAMTIFFIGGKVTPKKDISKEEYELGFRYFRKWLASFDPKHEDKELVCGYILSLIAEV